jgi:hypothetical protein
MIISNIEGIGALRKKVVLDPSRRLHENLDIGAKFYLQSHMPEARLGPLMSSIPEYDPSQERSYRSD